MPYYRNTHGRGHPQRCPFSYKTVVVRSSLNLFVENVYGHNILTRFDNRPNRFSHYRVMALYLYNKLQMLCPLSSSNSCFLIFMKLK